MPRQNPEAIPKVELVDKLAPVSVGSPLLIHTEIQHRDDFVGGAPVSIPPEDCPT